MGEALLLKKKEKKEKKKCNREYRKMSHYRILKLLGNMINNHNHTKLMLN